MPLSNLQSKVLRCISENRNPESYLAGATLLHIEEDSPRFSQDLDLFHDLAESVAICATKDAETLRDAGYRFSWLLQTPAFFRAVVGMKNEKIKIEWAQDSAFRFFPIQKDDNFGFCLHRADAALNKLLALAGRQQVRDYVDVIHLDETYLSLGAMAWAACGKDPGFTPEFLLDQAGRHLAYTQSDINRLSLKKPLDLGVLKKKWFKALEGAMKLLSSLPAEDIGCLYLDIHGNPVTPQPESEKFASLIRHHGSIRGAWPEIKS